MLLAAHPGAIATHGIRIAAQLRVEEWQPRELHEADVGIHATETQPLPVGAERGAHQAVADVAGLARGAH